MSHEGPCVPYPGGQFKSCVKCGRPYHEPIPDTPAVPLATEQPQSRDMGQEWAVERNPALERKLTRMAHQAEGVAVPFDENLPTSLDAYSESRTAPGPLRYPRNWPNEGRQEVGDCRNYYVWEAIDNYEGYLAGESEASEKFSHAMWVLAAVAEVWRRATSIPT
jgi:hypothetical protein